jgi:hypothetical protein
MIPYDIDPSLHTAEPEPLQLDDGFSPPHHVFVAMATHPVEPEPEPGDEASAPNPSHLPVEPEFAPELPPSDPEDPHGKPPTL